MAIQELELLQPCGGGVGIALLTKTAVFCAPLHHLLFFCANMNSNVIMNHLIEEEFQSPNPFFPGGLDIRSHCKIIQHIDSDTRTSFVANKKSYQVQFSLGGSLEGRTTVNLTKEKLRMHKRYTCAAYSQLM